MRFVLLSLCVFLVSCSLSTPLGGGWRASDSGDSGHDIGDAGGDSGEEPDGGDADVDGDDGATADSDPPADVPVPPDVAEDPDAAVEDVVADTREADTPPDAPPDTTPEDVGDLCADVVCPDSQAACVHVQCDPLTGQCGTMVAPQGSDCTNNGSGVCLDGACVECIRPADCLRGGGCQRAACRGNRCATTWVDDGTQCSRTDETPGFCRRGFCAECSSDDHCTDPLRRFCSDGICGQCDESEDCQGELDECLHWVCSGRQCFAVGNTGVPCDDGEGICFTHRCVDCYRDEHCDADASCEDMQCVGD